jgi:hydrogenase expression/formation protein HypE
MQVGKLPPEMLARLVGLAARDDPRVIVGPRVGEDAAAIDLGGGRVLVVKADPITFASDLIGWYAVHVNANDVATMGARPAFFMATLLLPETFDPDGVEAIFRQIGEACDEVGAVLVGGHTEVTHGIDAPLLAGSMIGEVMRDQLVVSAGARTGDHLLLTKGIAIEGSAVLAREVPDVLAAAGVREGVIAAAREFLFRPGISIVRDCEVLRGAGEVHAMHDPTEGGLAAALYELAAASGRGLEVDVVAVPVLPETEAIAGALGLDPMRMLGSGALLAAVPGAGVGRAIEALRAGGVMAADVGRVTEPGDAVILKAPDGDRVLEPTYQDEVARFLATQGSRAHPPGSTADKARGTDV